MGSLSVEDYYLENKDWLIYLSEGRNSILKAMSRSIIEKAENEISTRRISGETNGCNQ
ncbi:MAG: hypothetical protein QF682_07840 [Candidatus Thermoplasmatota archaeon]|jgi:hypothetical protein|nr:hypothetical protein [Candidatus Thermoplasmatota archaeon]